MRAQQQQPHRLARRLRQHVAHGEEIAQALGHLLAIHQQHAVMQPDAGEFAAGEGAAALRQLVLVMREDQILAAAVDIEALAQIPPGHRTALDMPAWPPTAPGTVPAGKVGRGGLPQHEIAGVALVRRDIDARAGEQFVRAAAGQLAVIGIAGDGEQHVALGRIGVAAGDQAFDQDDHLGDVLGGTRLDIGGQGAQRGHVLVKFRRGGGGDGGDALPGLGRAGVDLVIDVGDVAHIGHAREQLPQQPGQHVEHHHRTGVADMRKVVDGRPANVHPHMRGIERHEPFFPVSEAVGQEQLRHGGLLSQVPDPVKRGICLHGICLHGICLHGISRAAQVL